jgi:hypothetical protein
MSFPLVLRSPEQSVYLPTTAAGYRIRFVNDSLRTEDRESASSPTRIRPLVSLSPLQDSGLGRVALEVR